MNKDNNKRSSTISQLVSTGFEQAKNIGSRSSDKPSGKQLDKPLDKPRSKEKKRVKLLKHLLKTNMLVPGSSIDDSIRDEYRRIKRPLVSNAVGRNRLLVERGNVILVTSSIPGEGKSYTSLNLALSMANEMDNTVLLVDGDITRQGLSRSLGIHGTEGLVDTLGNDDLSIGEVMLHTDVPKLNVVSAGKHQNEYVAELLASQRMADLIDELASRYSDRIVIIDGPPLLPTPQTQILSGLVGQVVFVIEAGKTSQALVTDALELIPDDQAVGLVLNKNEGLSSRGGYGYGYGYGYYATDKQHPK